MAGSRLHGDGFGDDAGDVVGRALGVRQVDQSLCDLLGIVGLAECCVQGRAVNDCGQPVGAQQVAIAHNRGSQRQVSLDLIPARTKGTHQQSPLWVRCALLAAQFALINQRLHVGVVLGQLEQLTTAQEICPGVADMHQGQL
jgi:hypothetical protein